MALHALRVLAVASIFAFALTARTVSAAQAHTNGSAADPPPAVVDLPPTDLGDQPPTDTPPTDPVVAEEPPPDGLVEPAPTDPTLADTPPTDPAVAEEPPPTDPVGPAPTDPPPTDPPPTDPPIAEEPPPTDPVGPAADPSPTEPPIAEEPPPTDPVGPAPTDASPTVDDPAVSDPSAAEVVPPLPSAPPTPVVVSPIDEDPAHPATAPTPAVLHTTRKPIVSEPVSPTHSAAPAPAAVGAGRPAHARSGARPVELMPGAAGLVVGLAVTNRAPVSVAVAIEFGRAGGGWASSIVFSLWLRRRLRERPMSQRKLAALSGVDHSTISRLLGHDRTPSLATATKLAKALRHVQGESDTANYFERIPEETVFPARQVEMALRADGLLDDEEVRRLMNIYLDARRRHLATPSSNGRSSNGPTSLAARSARAAPDPRR